MLVVGGMTLLDLILIFLLHTQIHFISDYM